MLASIIKSWDDVEQLLIDRDQIDRLVVIDKLVVERLLKILKPFKETILALEVCEHPTLHSVWLHLIRLQEHLRQLDHDSNDDDECHEFVLELLQLLERNFTIEDEHSIATFLHPSFKSLTSIGCTRNRQREIQYRVRDLVNRIHIETERQECDSSTTSSEEVMATEVSGKRKRPSVEDDLLESFCPKRPSNETLDEVEKYLGEEDERVPAANVLAWWENKSHVYPRLASLARKFFSVPATSAASETIFSYAGRTITDLRSSLNSETVNKLLFLYYND